MSLHCPWNTNQQQVPCHHNTNQPWVPWFLWCHPGSPSAVPKSHSSMNTLLTCYDLPCSVGWQHSRFSHACMLWWRPLIFHLQPHKPGQNEPYPFIFPLFVVILICLFFFYLLIVHLVFYLIISFTPFHTSCTQALPFMVTLHNNSNQSNSASIPPVSCSPRMWVC